MNAMIPVTTDNALAYRASTDAANLSRDMVLACVMEIQGRKYVKVEGWQAIAIAHGCTGSARDVERVEGGVRAIGEVRRMSDGAVIAEAEGFVGEDEATWYGGETVTKYGKKTLPKRPDYAIRAMAQTRAISRACRSAFAHVVVMMNAGLSTTPAEEVPMGGFGDEPNGEPRNITPQGNGAIKRLTSAQAKEKGIAGRIKDSIWDCETMTALAAWDADFDKHTAECPLAWLDSIRNDIILRGEEIGRQTVQQPTGQDARGNPTYDDDTFPGDREASAANNRLAAA